MNKAFDYNGTLVSTSKPTKQLRTVKKTVLIDSADRDTLKYYTNGDVVYYLPHVYENVVSIRLKSATFPRLVDDTSAGALTHSYVKGLNTNIQTTSQFATDGKVAATTHYFLIELEGLNKSDETTVNAQRSTYPDNFYAKIPATLSLNNTSTYYIEYNDHTNGENIAQYSPPIGKLDRLHIITRLHNQQDKSGFIYWTTDGEVAAAGNRGDGSNYSLEFEIETLDNGFDNFSTFETRIHNREAGNYGC